MMTRTYVPENKPAKLHERFLMHPMENGVAAVCVFSGLQIMLMVFLSYTSMPSALNGLPPILLVIISTVLLAGGVCALLGLHWRKLQDIGRGWALERAGWSFVAAGFAAYIVAVVLYFPAALIQVPVHLLFIAMAGVRIVALYLIEKKVRRVKRKLQGEV